MKILIAVLVIVPWSLIFGTAYLAYRRVRGQRREAEAFMKSIEITEPLTEERKAWMADMVEQSKAAETRGTNSLGPGERQGPSTWSKADATPTYEEMKEGWKTADADHIAKIGRA